MKRIVSILAAWLLLSAVASAQIIGGNGIIGGRPVARGAVYTPACATAFASEADWFVFMQNRNDPAKGYRVQLKLSTNVHALYGIVEGAARPAWYPGNADRGNVTWSGGLANTSYATLTAANHYVEWDVPAAAAGCDTLVVVVVGVAGGGTFDIVADAGLDGEATIGTAATANGTTNYRLARTVDISAAPLAGGQTLRLRWTTGETANCRIASIYAYDTDGEATSYSQQIYVPGVTPAIVAGSSIEFAVQMAPYGSDVKFVGGYAHQGGSYATEINVSETWTRNGDAWTPTTGWVDGMFILHRTSDIDYDGGPTVIATTVCDYQFLRERLEIDFDITASAQLGLAVTYLAMMPYAPGGAVAYLSTGSTLVTTPQDDANVEVSAEDMAAMTWMSSATPTGEYARRTIRSLTHPIESVFVWRNESYDKAYWDVNVNASAPVPAETVFGSASAIEFRTSP